MEGDLFSVNKNGKFYSRRFIGWPCSFWYDDEHEGFQAVFQDSKKKLTLRDAIVKSVKAFDILIDGFPGDEIHLRHYLFRARQM